MTKHKKIINFVFVLVISLFFASYLKLTIFPDEMFSLNLIHHNFIEIVKLDSLDVHPPLYYLVVKIIFDILLWKGHSIISEIILGRIISIAFTIVAFFYLTKINLLMGIKLSKKLQFIILILLPNVIGVYNLNNQAMEVQPAVAIRMYAMASMLFIMTFYYILKFSRYDRNRDAFLVLICGLAAAYTHYFAGLMTGILILSYFIYFAILKKYKPSVKLFLVGITYIILYLPWTYYAAVNQVDYVSGGYWINERLFHINFLEIFMFAVVFIVPFYLMLKDGDIKDKIALKMIFIVNFSVVFISSVLSVFFSPVLLLRYMYPSLLVYEFISLSYVFWIIKEGKNTKLKNYGKKIVLLLSCLFVFSLANEMITRIPRSIEIYASFKKSYKMKEPYYKDSKRYTQDLMYLKSLGVKSKVDTNKVEGYKFYVWKSVYDKLVK